MRQSLTLTLRPMHCECAHSLLPLNFLGSHRLSTSSNLSLNHLFSFFFPAMLSARDACVRASAYHATVRERDAANILGISPLLADRDLAPLPSSAEAGKVSRKICGDCDRDVETKFVAYHRQVTLGCYAPLVPDTDRSPLSHSCLPGGVAVVDHVLALANSQNSALSGGSFLPFISGTLDLCTKYRQPSADLRRVRTLIFSVSADAEIVSFIQEFIDDSRCRGSSQRLPSTSLLPL